MPRIMTDEMHEFLLQNYKGILTAELTDKINKRFSTSFTVSQIRSYKSNHHLPNGFDGRFKKGNVPYNKGKKGLIHPGCQKGWFMKGQMPHNHKPVGSERVTVDGYIEIKVSEPNKWRLKHRLIWEQANGQIPKNTAIVFLDGNKQNADIANLKLISRAELLIMNRHNLFKADRDLSDISTNLAKMIVAKHRAKKRQKEAPQ